MRKPTGIGPKVNVFYALCRKYDVPIAVPEYRFDTVSRRRWRFDYAWPAQRVALEVEGGVWVRGRHTRGKGYVNDLEKYSEAAAQGWRLIRVTPDQLCTLETIELLKRALAYDPASLTPAA